MNLLRSIWLIGGAVCLLATPLNGDPVRLANTQRRPPLLICTTNGRGMENAEGAWRKLLSKHEVAEYEYQARRVVASQLPRLLGPLKAGQDEKGRGHDWFVLLPDGTLSASGPGIPSSETLIAAFQAAGLKSLVEPLRRFSKSYPSHVPARLRLAEALLSRNLRLPPSEAPGSPGAADADRTKYEEMGKQFNHLVMNTDVTRSSWRLREILDQAQRGGLSPVMRSFVEACLPRLHEICRQAPYEEGPLSLYLRVCEVLDRPVDLSFLLAHDWFKSPGLSFPFPNNIPGMLVRRNRTSEQWAGTLDLLRRVWAESYLPRIQRRHFSGEGQVRLKHIADSRDEGWRDFAEPLLEAMFASNRETEVIEWLNSLDASWATVHPYKKVARMAVARGKVDLAAQVRRLEVRGFAPAVPGLIRGRPVLFFDGSHREQVYRVADRFAAEGTHLEVRKVEPPWIEFLSWGKGQKAWVLVGQDGKELAQAAQWLPEEEMMASIRAVNLVPPRLEAMRFLEAHPENRKALLAFAEACLAEALTLATGPISIPLDFDRGARVDSRFEEYANAIDELLRAPFGAGDVFGAAIHSNLPDLCRYSEGVAKRMERLGRVALPRLQDWLAAFPDDRRAWESWATLKNCTNGDLDFGFSSFPGQRQLGFGPVPPYRAWADIVSLCQQRRAWEDLNAFLLPRLEEEIQIDLHPAHPNLGQGESRQILATGIPILVHSMIESGRTADLVPFLSQCLTAGVKGLELGTSVARCRADGNSAVADLLESLSTFPSSVR